MEMHRFPFVNWLAFLTIAGMVALATTIAANGCGFGFGGYQCNGWLASIASVLWWTTIVGVLLGALLRHRTPEPQ